jgi:DNA-binding GntR family transcriptional regulator
MKDTRLIRQYERPDFGPCVQRAARHNRVSAWLTAQSGCDVRRTPRSKDGVPVMATESWIPAEIGRTVTEELILAQPLYKVLMEQGINFDRLIKEITAVLANPIYRSLADRNRRSSR